jgi:hypothetical protein
MSSPPFRGAFVDSMEIVIETPEESKYPPCPLFKKNFRKHSQFNPSN